MNVTYSITNFGPWYRRLRKAEQRGSGLTSSALRSLIFAFGTFNTPTSGGTASFPARGSPARSTSSAARDRRADRRGAGPFFLRRGGSAAARSVSPGASTAGGTRPAGVGFPEPHAVQSTELPLHCWTASTAAGSSAACQVSDFPCNETNSPMRPVHAADGF